MAHMLSALEDEQSDVKLTQKLEEVGADIIESIIAACLEHTEQQEA